MNNPNEKPGQSQDQQGQQRMREQQQQRQGGSNADLSQIKQHMEVVGSDGARVGTVDNVEGNRIKLTKDGGDHHRYVECSSVASVEGGKVKLSTAGKGAAS